ncbi:tetratricopeptide repeat protein [Dysgonomonas macrotermitis]|uniref:Tetratricopeptide repeat-containing protein n=1 Tax=Dysgonomonas macrotermitis TaxID=1346286 RepID=A0A1M5GZV7_9BACT|nr:tetratricopeptide repeat protein [Dysgonomonas macrotermitis]SHG09186.1 Tetratricopeptide repeat-containing protein [Dysgonomonas macrotermitis]
MKKKYLLGAFLGLLLSTPIFAQSNLGADYLNTGELKVAKEIFEKQVSQSPAEAYYYLGEVAYKEGNTAEAKSNYEKGLAASADFVLNNVGLGKLLLKTNPKEAEDQFSIALKKDKKDVRVLVAIAEAYYANNMAQKGEAKLADARKADKKSPLIYLLEGDLKAKTNVGEAAGSYAQAYNFDPTCAVAYIKSAQVYEAVNPTLAIEMLQKAVEINPNYTLAYKMLGSIYSHNGQYADAIEAYKKYFAQGAYDVSDLTRYAAALYFTKQYDEAKKLINEGISKEPNNFVLNRLLMYSYLQSKDYTDGLAVGDKFFSLDKGDSEYIVQDFMTYGELLSKNNQLDKALLQYEAAVKLDPSKSTVYKEIAMACVEGNQYADAAKYLQQYVDKADPAIVEATDYFNIGRYSYMAGTAAQKDTVDVDAPVKAKALLQQSDKAFATVSERIPDSYLGYFWRARANAALDPETTEGLAKPYYEKVIEIALSKDDGSNNNELIEAYRYLSYYYYLAFDKSKSASDKDAVKSYSEKILALDPENGVAKQLLEAVK